VFDLSLHLLDLLQNSAHAGASHVEIEILEDEREDLLRITVKDDGRGMSREEKRLALDPFYSSSPRKRIGLGLPLVFQGARMTGGTIDVDSHPGSGTRVTVDYALSHVDRQPLGDVASTIVSFVAGNPQVSVSFSYKGPKGEFEFDTRRFSIGTDKGSLGQIGFLSDIDQKIREGLDKAGFRPDRGSLSVLQENQHPACRSTFDYARGGFSVEVPRGTRADKRGGPF